MVQLKWQYTVTLGFIICSVLLLAIIAFQVHYARQYREQIITEINNVKSSGFVLDAMPVLPEDNKPVVAYTDFVERPLFFSDRRPVVMDIAETEKEQQGAVVKKVPVAKKISMILIGIINIPEGMYALFQNPKAKPTEAKFLRFQQGNEIEGWTIKEIVIDRVLLEAQGENQVILLTKPRNTKYKNKQNSVSRRTLNPFNRTNK